jgi:hypothetical protein
VGLNTLLAAYTNTTGLNTLLAAYTNTTGLNTLLAAYTNTTALNTLLAAYTNTAGLNTLLAAYTNTTGLNTLLAAYTNTAGLTTLLAGKQATLTSPGAGVFLNGTTLSGYGLRWNATSVPTGIIQELHWSNYTVNQTVNFGTGKVELTIGHPTDMATQTQLATKQDAVAGLSYGTVYVDPNNQVSSIKTVGRYLHLEDPGNYPHILFKVNTSNHPHRIAASDAYWYLEVNSVNTKIDFYTKAGLALDIKANSKNVQCYGTFTSASDKKLKKDVRNASIDACQTVFDKIDAKVYKRNDIETTSDRIGFIAQDFQENLPPEFQNIVSVNPSRPEDREEAVMGLDYGRLTAILWGVVKKQQKQIDNLIAKVNA